MFYFVILFKKELFMKRPWLVALLLCLFFSVWDCSASDRSLPGPKMMIKEPSFDFKDVKEGATIEHTFQVLNMGDQTLKIKKVKPG